MLEALVSVPELALVSVPELALVSVPELALRWLPAQPSRSEICTSFPKSSQKKKTCWRILLDLDMCDDQ
jgi:hypothetical protein